jgi:TPP-dependent pyruvate/acetoin dehydrogenase alpha subunit
MTLPDDTLFATYRDILRVRTLENRLEENHRKGLVPGFFHQA